MLVPFFFELRAAGVPVSITELLTLLEALEGRVSSVSAQDFYHLARACLVKDERHYDRFDRVFAHVFQGAEAAFAQLLSGEVPQEWLRSLAGRTFSEEEKRRIQSLGGWEKLLETLKARLAEQRARHEGGSKWVGTGGTSPFGNAGYHPEGIRIGGKSQERRAVKVWEERAYANFDDDVQLGTRNLKLALRKLRSFAREGAADQLDLAGTIDATARNGGLLDVKLVAERHNAVKVLLFLGVGGSMDDHVTLCEQLFSAARSEFRHLQHFYFHNFIYEHLWRDNTRRQATLMPTEELLRTYGRDYRVILVGDATMSPYEISQPGGSIEHWNKESGAVWMQRLCSHFPRLVWLNPEDPARWEYAPSLRLARALVAGRMFPLSIGGLDLAIAELRRPLNGAQPLSGGDANGITKSPPPQAP